MKENDGPDTVGAGHRLPRFVEAEDAVVSQLVGTLERVGHVSAGHVSAGAS